MANKYPHILLLDIETSPIKGYTWGVYEQNLLKILEPSKIICVSWRWIPPTGRFRELNHNVGVKALPDFPGYKAGVLDDKRLVKFIWDLLDQADVVIAHNGDSFDVKKLNARFIYYNLNAPSAYKTVDTRKVAKKHFRFDNNKLDVLGDYLGEGRKVSTGGFDLWDDCINGVMKAWRKMKRYNIRDITLLERVYLRLRPFMDNHPNLNVIVEDGVKHDAFSCPACLSKNTSKRGFSITRTGRYQRYQCNDCGTWSSGGYKRAKEVAIR